MNFARERKPVSNKSEEVPVMCIGCNGFFARSYKARDQLICPSATSNIMVPMVNISEANHLTEYSKEFKELLNTLLLDEVGNYIKTDVIILMFGERSFNSSRRNKDKVIETKKSFRARMRLIARLYLCFRKLYAKQSTISLNNRMNNAADMYCREVITILGQAVSELCEKSMQEDIDGTSILDQKSGLKVSILNLLKLTANFLMGYFLVKCMDQEEKRVSEFLKVLKSYENDYFGDAYYDLKYRRNVHLRKPVNLPKDEDVKLLISECRKIMTEIDSFDHPAQSYITIRSATATYLTIFCARRGGEPVRLQIYQWEEALKREWVDREDLPNEFHLNSMLITYQTGKGSNHLVPVVFPPESIKAMKYLTDKHIRGEAGVNERNEYVFASTQQSESHASGWHCIDDILTRLSLKGTINATRNRHRVASLLSKLELSEQERKLVYQHFGHSQNINENVYQAPAGSLQLQTTAQRLLQINSLMGNETEVDCSTSKLENVKKTSEVRMKIDDKKCIMEKNEVNGEFSS